MKGKEFRPIRLTDEKTVQEHYNAAAKIVDSLNKVRQTYIDMFGKFDMTVFFELYSPKRPINVKRIALTEYLKVRKIDTGNIDINKAIELGLVKLPYFSKLLDGFNSIKRTLDWNHHSYLKNITDLLLLRTVFKKYS